MLKQGKGGFLTHTGNARNVIDRVSHEGQQIDDELRRHTKLIDHPIAVQDNLGHGIDQGDVVIHQLRHVLVTGGNKDRSLLRARHLRQGANYIIGLDTRDR